MDQATLHAKSTQSLAQSGPTQPVDPTKEIAITNNSGVPVVVLVPTGSDVDGGSGGVMVWGQELEILPTLDGTPVIANGATGTVVLDLYSVDSKSGQYTYSTIYDLLISTADWYLPVANIVVMQDTLTDPASYPAQTVTSDDAAALANAGVFYQAISAYPTSALAQDFQTAMQGANSAALAAADGSSSSSVNAQNAIDSAVNAFFQGTESFQNVTLGGLVAMENYYQSFPFAWAQFTTTTYYLYSSDGTTTSFVGTITLTQPGTLDLTQPNANYACSFAPAVTPTDTTSVSVDTSKSVSLTYGNGLFVDDTNADVPQIAVKGTFQIKRLFTQVSTDTQIITVLTGAIYGATCLGFDQPQSSDAPQNSDYWNAIFHPENSSQIFQSIMTLGGAVMMLFFSGQIAWGTFNWLSGLIQGNQPTTQEMLEQQQAILNQPISDQLDEAVQKISNGTQDAPSDPEAAAQDIAAEQGSVVDNVNAGSLDIVLLSQASSLEQLAVYEADMNDDQLNALQSAANAVRASNTALNDATSDTLHQVVTEQTEAVGIIQTSVTNLANQMSAQLSQVAQDLINENAQTVTEALQDIEDANQNQEEDATNDDPDVGDPVGPSS